MSFWHLFPFAPLIVLHHKGQTFLAFSIYDFLYIKLYLCIICNRLCIPDMEFLLLLRGCVFEASDWRWIDNAFVLFHFCIGLNNIRHCFGYWNAPCGHLILSVLDSELLHNVDRNFRCFLVTAERVILDKIWNYKLLEWGGGGGGRRVSTR